MNFKNNPRCHLLEIDKNEYKQEEINDPILLKLQGCGCCIPESDHYYICETCGKPVCKKHVMVFDLGYPIECPKCYENNLLDRLIDQNIEYKNIIDHQVVIIRELDKMVKTSTPPYKLFVAVEMYKMLKEVINFYNHKWNIDEVLIQDIKKIIEQVEGKGDIKFNI